MKPVFIPPGMTKYLEPLDIHSFQDYKYLVKKIVEYSKTHQSICGDIDLTMKEAIKKYTFWHTTSSLLPPLMKCASMLFKKL